MSNRLSPRMEPSEDRRLEQEEALAELETYDRICKLVRLAADVHLSG